MLKNRLDGLWAATVESSALSFESHRFEMILRVLDGGQMTAHTLVLARVRSFEYVRANYDEAWDYTELTSIDATESGGMWRVSAELWTDTLTIRCDEIEVDGEGLVPQGSV